MSKTLMSPTMGEQRGHNFEPWSMKCRLCGETLSEIQAQVSAGGPETCSRDRKPHLFALPKQSDSPMRTPVRTTKPKLVYVSGPLTTGQLTANVRAALNVGKQLVDAGYAVIVPHEKLITEILHPMSYEEWLSYDFRIILCCDAVLRMPGESHGGDREVEFAIANGIPVYYSLDTLYAEQRV